MCSLPNILTILRLALIPVLVVVFYIPFQWSHYLATAIFVIASVTDWLDGYLARKWGQVTLLGAFLDPVADKLLVSTCLLLLVGAKEINFITLPAIVIVGREIVISALREWMAEWGKRASIAVGKLGKIKTVLQMIALILLLAFHPSTTLMGVLGVILLYIAALMTIWSMAVYMRIAYQEMMLLDLVSKD
jgi:CDP-diacylglycerol--glycerol-3-phosphate 3-phosphatidyltransferase